MSDNKVTSGCCELSCEFFPPKTAEGQKKLDKVWRELMVIQPKFFSVTFGAGGSTQSHTFETVTRIQEQSGIDTAPHLSCVGSTKENVLEMLRGYQARGIRRIVALRGDIPSGMLDPGEFRYASELVRFIREETGDHFFIEVAAYPEYHPQATSAQADLNYFREKVNAGANGAITQYFYNADAYFYFRDACFKAGIEIPIIPGIMPITQFAQLARFSDSCGAEIPRWLRRRLEGLGDDSEAIRKLGYDVTVNLCRRLLVGGAPGLHFYSMNQSEPTLSICSELGLISSQ